MKQQELDAVVKDVYSRTYQLWTEKRARLTKNHDHGFKILYSPPRLEPSALVIGLQPAGNVSHMREAELQTPSETNEYLSESWKLAVALRERSRFSAAYLQGVVGTNAIFFRSPNFDVWTKIESELRVELENFCVNENKRLIQAMLPKQILLLGWDALALMGGTGFHELIAHTPIHGRRRRKRLLQSGKIMGIPAFAIPHPSQAWKNPPVTPDDWEEIRAKIGEAVC